MDYVISASAAVVPIAVALQTVTDGMVPIVAGTLAGEADRNGRFIRGPAVLMDGWTGILTVPGYRIKVNGNYYNEHHHPYLVLAHHRHLLHGMQNVSERDIRVLPMNLVGALDAQVEWRWTVRGVRDADVVVVADLHRLSIA